MLPCAEMLKKCLQYCIGAFTESSSEFKEPWQEWEPNTGLELGTLTTQGSGSGRGLIAKTQGQCKSLDLEDRKEKPNLDMLEYRSTV